MKALATSSLAERWRRLVDSDLYFSFRRSPVTVGAAVVTGIIILSAVFAPLIAPHDPYDLTTLSLLDAFAPPVWFEDGTWNFMLGTDDQGRGMLSAIIYGARLSLLVGVVSVLFSGIFGVALGLISGYVGGRTDAIIMRIAEVQLTFPAILIALLIDGVLRGILPVFMLEDLAIYVVIVSIGISGRSTRAPCAPRPSSKLPRSTSRLRLSPASVLR